ncbi:MAG: PLP-dependent aminotransferase family protein, partial [Gammaproteobacteria bacterium]
MTRIAFERADDDDLINFAVGQPDRTLIAVDKIQASLSTLKADLTPQSLNYGLPRGEDSFLAPLARFLTHETGVDTQPDHLMLTAGSSQALDMICLAFTEPGDTVLIEDASYFLAFQIFKDRGLQLVSVPRDAGGIDLAALQSLIEAHRPKLFYTIPFFSNPRGDSLPVENLVDVVTLCEKTSTLVVSDEAYQCLNFDGRACASIANRTSSDWVLSLGTFSKILAPGLRVGWLEGPPERLNELANLGWVNSGGAVNQWGSLLVARMLEDQIVSPILTQIRRTLATRASLMHEGLLASLGELAHWHKPEGGYFFWIELKADIDTQQTLPAIRAKGVGYQPGVTFSAQSQFRSAFRLSYAAY